MLYVEAEVHDVSVLHDVVLALDRHATSLLDSRLRAVVDVVLILNHLSTYEATLEVGVYDARTLRSLASLDKSPGTALISSSRKEGLEIEQLVGCTDQTVDTRLLQP